MVIFSIGAWPSATPTKLAKKQREKTDLNIFRVLIIMRAVSIKRDQDERDQAEEVHGVLMSYTKLEKHTSKLNGFSRTHTSPCLAAARAIPLAKSTWGIRVIQKHAYSRLHASSVIYT